ncbi:MAG: LysR family transcriptional regulator [Pigmentiphaga sp.]|uniref:LysR family transcriptional regulator n=1 Tax=Pigmentiphaga sp. TaxID=1977564 RepID=UPI0029BA60EA|nr:LysR family transcriptional regulator [Pigmentiphaga sp.]MDX3905936.1 LysR family transcriptional regulator [Pigmentiphaga sp.]
MRYHKLDLNLLVALDALLEEASVSRAAERIYLSQPAMSSALSRLREHFGDPLLVSLGRRMVLTDRAQALRGEVREILLRIQEVTQPAGDFEPARAQRTFSIAASDYFSVVVLPRLLAHCARHAPGIHLEIYPLSPKLSEGLERGEIDLLIIPSVYALPDYPQATLFEDPWLAIAWQGNALIGDTLTEDQYFDLEHVIKRENHPMFPPLDERSLSSFKRRRKVAAGVPQYSLLPMCLPATPHIATVQSGLARRYAQWLPLRLMDLPITIPPLTEVMQWPRHKAGDDGMRWLRDSISEVCAQLFRGQHIRAR